MTIYFGVSFCPLDAKNIYSLHYNMQNGQFRTLYLNLLSKELAAHSCYLQ